MKKTLIVAVLNVVFLICSAQEKASLPDTLAQKQIVALPVERLEMADSLVVYAQNFMGVKYKYAGSTPESGFDCSGFVNYIFKKTNIPLPRSSKYFDQIGQVVPVDSCLPGDIVLFARHLGNNFTGHVGIVIEKTPDSFKFIHASTRKGIVIDDYKTDFFFKRYRGIRRVLKIHEHGVENLKLPEEKG
jgi:cell wall-associated NlpC family hydrolase